MGCFSYLCKESGEPANSTSFDGTPCRLFVLFNGEVMEEMHGNYDSYGKVFDVGNWELDWHHICSLQFDENNKAHGMAVVLDRHWEGNAPTEQSESDPNQGWGSDSQYLADCSSDEFPTVEKPYHKVHVNTKTHPLYVASRRAKEEDNWKIFSDFVKENANQELLAYNKLVDQLTFDKKHKLDREIMSKYYDGPDGYNKLSEEQKDEMFEALRLNDRMSREKDFIKEELKEALGE